MRALREPWMQHAVPTDDPVGRTGEMINEPDRNQSRLDGKAAREERRMVAHQTAWPARAVGRPRRLTLDRLLDTAIELGLADLNMKDLAARLDVGIATLYRYVENRDALIRLAVGRQAVRAAPADVGQPWQDIVRDYAASLFSSVGQEPALLIGFLEARWGTAVELEFADGFLGALAARGFSAAEAMWLYRSMGKIVLGAAVAAGHFAALTARGTSQARELSIALDAWDADELIHLRKASKDYADEAAASDWRAPLDLVLRNMEARRSCD